MSKLKLAHLNYGSAISRVKPTEVLPLPTTFDFDDVEQCARKIFAIMSNASGGFTLKDCKVRYDANRRTANLTSSGCHVFYQDDTQPKVAVEQAIELYNNSVVLELGDVYADQYGEGWKRASWRANA